MLLISPSHQRSSRRALGVDAARRVERQPQQRATEDQDADAGRDPHPIPDGGTKEDRHQESSYGRQPLFCAPLPMAGPVSVDSAPVWR